MTSSKICSQRNETKKKLIAYFVAVAFLFNSICLLADILFPSITNFGKIFVIDFLALGLVACLIPPIRVNLSLLFINGTVFFLIILSYLFYDFSENIKSLMLNYVVWGIGITFIMIQRYDIRKMLNISYWISLIIILFELIIDATQMYESMTWTYSVFPCVATTMIHFAYCRFSKIVFKLTYIPGFLMLIKFMLNANRGGFISVIILLFFISIKSVNSTQDRLKSRKILSLVFLIFALIIGLCFDQIISYLYNYMQSFDFEIHALTKMYKLMVKGNITNSRGELYAYAWNGFLSSPIWGNGVGGFTINHGGWTHNFILQLLYEGGILLSSLILIPLAKNCLFVLKEKRITSDEYSLFVLLFAVSIPKLLVSTELWNTQGFWMLFAFCMIIKIQYTCSRSNLSYEYIIRR